MDPSAHERARRLSEIVEQAPFHVMVLRGPGLLLETMNPPLAELFHTDRTANRPFDEICTDPALKWTRRRPPCLR